MKFGYTIIYVSDVNASLSFFEKAFGLKTRFIHESGYGELETGETTLAFASHDLGTSNLSNGYIAVDKSIKPLGVEIALITDSVVEVHVHAVAVGATSLLEPIEKPWGQTVSYIRCPDGTLVELCSPLSS
tara:strand:+ start:900 stop:1289 length:390 start_codon:yes stop_codon:yes gene_type:complete